MRRSPERALHISIVQWLRVCAPDALMFHVPNGEHRDIRTAAKLKAFGTLAGVPDLVFVLPEGRVGFVEVKAEGGRSSPAQKAFEAACGARGALYAVCRSIPDIRQTLAEWNIPTREAA